MIEKSRRSFFKRLGLSIASLSFSFSGIASLFSISKKRFISEELSEESFQDDFSLINDRVWIGEKYWAIPMAVYYRNLTLPTIPLVTVYAYNLYLKKH